MSRWVRSVNLRALATDVFIWFFAIAICYVTKGAAIGILFVPVFFSISTDKQDLMFLFLLLFVGLPMTNHILVPKGVIFNLSTKLLWVGLAVFLAHRIMGRRQSPLATPFLGILVYISYSLLPSLLGWNPTISLLKWLLFLVTFLAFYEIANVVILSERAAIINLRTAFLSFAAFILIGSMLLIPFPSISQMRMEDYMDAVAAGKNIVSLYCGVMYHSQALGPVVATMVVAVFCDYIFSIRKNNWFYNILLMSGPILVFKTSSRTAMGTLLVGMMFAFWLFMKTRQVEARWKHRLVSTGLLVGIVGISVITILPQGRKRALGFLVKYGNDQVTKMSHLTADTIIASRLGKWEESIEGWKKSPIIGNGFQVSEAYKGWTPSSLKGYLSAPIEKSIWISAVLEEGGIVGFILVAGFWLYCISALIKRKAYTGASVAFTFLVTNMGEFQMFSMSGSGGYCWGMCFAGIILDAQRLREENISYWYAVAPTEADLIEMQRIDSMGKAMNGLDVWEQEHRGSRGRR